MRFILRILKKIYGRRLGTTKLFISDIEGKNMEEVFSSDIIYGKEKRGIVGHVECLQMEGMLHLYRSCYRCKDGI